ncbi:hypothetical protein [Phytoactinopolyspora limicola]|uniref:hypothetical protein n=1 Tax=Phytoactinopolyspora limicola TaxID=2715536 RepID=UPI0014093587|nr:hypothetical protein [Phytoactinopolyspora limicola]
MSFGLGLQIGAVLVALVAAVIGAVVQVFLPLWIRLPVFGVLAISVVLRELGLIKLPVPENRRLVPEDVQKRGRVWGPVQFGFEMGTGMRTYSPSAQPHLALLAIVLVVPFAGSLAMGVGFGAARLLMPVINNAYSDDGAWGDAWAAHARLLAALTCFSTMAALTAGLIAW